MPTSVNQKTNVAVNKFCNSDYKKFNHGSEKTLIEAVFVTSSNGNVTPTTINHIKNKKGKLLVRPAKPIHEPAKRIHRPLPLPLLTMMPLYCQICAMVAPSHRICGTGSQHQSWSAAVGRRRSTATGSPMLAIAIVHVEVEGVECHRGKLSLGSCCRALAIEELA